MKTSILHPTVMASAILLGSLFHCEPAMSDSCPAPSFAAARSFDTGPSPQSVAVGDFNGDGRPDLAVANAGCHIGCPVPNSVSVLLGNGDGSFQAAINYPAEGPPVSVAVGDVNGDGKLDLAVANLGCSSCSPPVDGSVSVMLGNGDGTFQAAVSFATGPNSFSVAVADFNGDERLDLAVANIGSYDRTTGNPINGSVSVLLGKGDGTFRAAVNSRVEFGGGQAVGKLMAVGDFNGDGKPDVTAVRRGFNVVSVLLGKGDGTFLAARDYNVLGSSVMVGDLNGDGKLDLAVAGYGTSRRFPLTVSVLLGEGNGTFKVAVDYISGAWSGEAGSVQVAVGDFNGDGQPDLAVANGDAANVSVLLGKGSGTFQAAISYDVGPRAYALAVDDLNRDGKSDLVVCTGSGVSVLLGKGDGTFPAAVKFAPGIGPVSVAVGDFNADGKLDLAVANSYFFDPISGDPRNSDVSVLLGKGDGAFEPAVNYLVGRGPGSVAVGDFNGDGKLDIVVANHVIDYRPGQTPPQQCLAIVG